MLMHGMTDFIQLAFVRLLQEAFSDESVPDEYRWAPQTRDPAVVSDMGQRQIWIYRANPNRETGLPAIFVETGVAKCGVTQLGNEDREIVNRIWATDPKTGKPYVSVNIYGGPLWIPVKLTVVAQSTTDRAIIGDLVAGLVRVVFRPVFIKAGIEYLDIEGGNTSEEGDNPANRRFYGEVNIQCQSQFKMPVSTALIKRVQKINLVETFTDAGGDHYTPPEGS